MKKSLLLVLFTLMTIASYAVKVGELPDVGKPSMISVNGNELYVGEGCVFSVYSLKDFSLLRQFGKKGEGPGELIERPNYPNKITVLKDRIFVTGIGKVISFSRDGKFQKEFKTHQRVIQLLPVGKNFVAKERGFAEDGKTAIMMINLYNSEMKKIKEIYRQDWVRQGSGTALRLNLGFDFVSFVVENDKIFIDKSPEGFVIDVFDSNGNKLYGIKNEYEKLPLTSAHKEQLVNMVKNDPAIKRDVKRAGGWNELMKVFTLEFPEFFAPIKGIEISGKKIYARTFEQKDGKEKYVVMDLKGKVIKTLYLPAKLETGLLAQLAGCKLFSISDERLYYIKENEEDEQWELHVEKL